MKRRAPVGQALVPNLSVQLSIAPGFEMLEGHLALFDPPDGGDNHVATPGVLALSSVC